MRYTHLGSGQEPLSLSSLTNFRSTSSHLWRRAFSASWEVVSGERREGRRRERERRKRGRGGRGERRGEKRGERRGEREGKGEGKREGKGEGKERERRK